MKTFLLIYEKGNYAIELDRSIYISQIQSRKKIFKKDPKYLSGKLVVRTLEGFKAKKIL